MECALDFERYHTRLDDVCPICANGRVTKVVGFVTESLGPSSRLGSVCDIYLKGHMQSVCAEVMGFRDNKVLLMPLGDMRGIGPGSRVVTREQRAFIPVGNALLGRVVDGLGQPIDGKGPICCQEVYPIYADPINPLLRQRICQPMDVGLKAVNGILTIGCGQRIGLFAGSGVGKSILLGMIAQNAAADVNVIAMIGERGREVNDFIEQKLGKEGLRRSVVVVATSDQLPLIRMRGAFIATAIAEYFRDQGLHVNLMMDSLTRFAMAQREIGLALGEPPTAKGYTPSVFTLLPRLLERAGTSSEAGSITGLYTVLVEGDDMNEPVADAVRSILDGHIVLTRDLAMQNHYPSIDVLQSISRVMGDVTDKRHMELSNRLKMVLDTYRKAEDLINIGAYVKGSNAKIDYSIDMIDPVNGYLKQDAGQSVSFEESIRQLESLFDK